MLAMHFQGLSYKLEWHALRKLQGILSMMHGAECPCYSLERPLAVQGSLLVHCIAQ